MVEIKAMGCHAAVGQKVSKLGQRKQLCRCCISCVLYALLIDTLNLQTGLLNVTFSFEKNAKLKIAVATHIFRS